MKVKLLHCMRNLSCKVCFKESCFLELKRKVGGKVHLKLSIGLRPIVNKYHEGIVKRTLRRKLEVPEIAAIKANGPDHVKQDCCVLTCKAGLCASVLGSTCSVHSVSCSVCQHCVFVNALCMRDCIFVA